ncbi:MAG TPA: aspartate aminotransferase family protein, partial [Thermoanaerobaculia bacterium]|nr:aspartate aminotransferase family protein [Thermoanaerobaculia bacterium]
MPKLDPSSDAFRAAGHRLIDWIGDYFDHIDGYDVLSRVQPGQVGRQFAAAPREQGASYDELLAEFEQKLLPGVTHW